ncbi:ABC transporter ATP-binding protein [Paenibacillus sp. IHBB 3054]|uniref:ABC transporter ATP-binding protein n=1 Tax=Paenibacillus sp. IHBB 3054 TaxID=3425689 RepID=UPI003F678424
MTTCIIEDVRMIIEVSDVVKKYNKLDVLKGVNLSIREGEIFGLLGPNGAGKSTLMNTILGLLRFNSGSVKILGKDFSTHATEIKREIGYVPQEIAVFETLNAIDNVTYWGRLYGLRGNELAQMVKKALEFTGLWDRRKSKVSTFSGGMKRRLNIACAIVHKPRVLFMDEPTVGVDPQSRNHILESIRIMNKEGTTVIYTTHYMEEIEAICDRVAIMDFGQIIALGTIDELIADHIHEQCLRLELTANTAEAVKVIESFDGVLSFSVNKEILEIKLDKGDSCIPRLLEQLIKQHFNIKFMEVKKPDLETVFLQLTGKKLRD